MEPILPEFPCEISQRISDLPEAQLIYAIIFQAWLDINGKVDVLIQEEARAWFFSDQFINFCYVLNLSSEAIQTRIKNEKGSY